MTTKNLLVELLVEELPPKSLKELGDTFAELLITSLRQQGLAANDAVVTGYATPRRLAACVSRVLPQAADKLVSQKLMPVAVGLNASGNATPALLKKLASLGADAAVVPHLMRAMDGKTEALYFDSLVKGVTLTEGLQNAVDAAITKLPIPKVMSYQLADGWSSVNFVRPAHGLLALHGADVVPVSVLGLTSGRTTQGHRFEAKSAILEIREADSYEAQLKNEGAVIASFAERRAEIVRQLAVAATKENLQAVQDEALLDEITALVEHPNVLLGKFEKEFLNVPPECLILTMKANQKYFPLIDTQGKLTNKFLIVSNITPADPSAVIQGNERVVRARLADAKFFFDKDRKRTLASRVTDLNKIVYHNKLGSQGERTQRVREIAKTIAQALGGDALAAQADQAAILAKADLTTDMVGEFPELQGIMGRYYAQHEGIDDEVAYAIEDHYKPRFSGDELPRDIVGVCVALADKFVALVDMFSIDEKPTGDRDPFALRRHALGVVRMLMDLNLPLELESLFQTARLYDDRVSTDLYEFIYDRLSGLLRDEGFSTQEVDAVLSLRPQVLADVPKRLYAVRAFATLPEAGSLAAANKRVGNILKKSSGKKTNSIVNLNLLPESAEKALHQVLTQVAPKADAAFAAGEYIDSLLVLANLRTPVDDFFDNVMVNTEDVALRNNRLALLSQLHQTMNRVADISKLTT